ncbi:hypothetical protein [Streptomyces sp. NPDC048663]|uniref:hypothetical protein n=1 Tax=Streptomyces sp. NPDC048663 TaxID=3155638 RepID=UPI003438328D
MNVNLVNSAAGVINAALAQNRTAAGIALALDSAQLLMTPETAAELTRLQERVAELEAREELVAKFVAGRAGYIVSIRNCHPDNSHDYDRWQGHAESRRQLSELLGLPVGWPSKDGER